ncbi:MAG: hypothetical protein Q8L90_03180 [Bacteroidota bacterium]|nr:hypothetical protein [Bacteroidota bacterium]
MHEQTNDTLRIKLTIILISCSFVLLGQKSSLICNGRQYEQYSGAWFDQGQNCKNEYYDSNRLIDLPSKDTSVINKIKEQLTIRAGKDFYRQFDLIAIIISKPSIKCNNIKYTFRYIYKVDTTFCYRFSLTYDKEGNLIGNNAFPSVKENSDFFKLSSACNSIDNLTTDTSFTSFYMKFKNNFKDAIDKVLLDYDTKSEKLVYKIYGITLAESKDFESGLMGSWNGKLVVIDAQTGEKIRTENYKEYKRVNIR